MTALTIRDRLVKQGRDFFDQPVTPTHFTKDAMADALLNDLDNHPHAFLLGCVMDRQIKAEKAWIIPYRLSKSLGTFAIKDLARLSERELQKFMTKPTRLHRFPEKMGSLLHSGIQQIIKHYSGDASLIWRGKPSSAEVVYRFLEFDGIGPKIATMATNILARNFKVPFADYFSVDISVDTHVRRVFTRLGLCPPGASVEQIIYRARALYPKFPGIMDLACFRIGRTWCSAQKPRCDACYMRDVCQFAVNQKH